MTEENNDKNKFKLKNDKYRSARGGEAHLLEISCTKCNSPIMKYQKDGKGNIIRCYLNRIFYPPELEKLQYSFDSSNFKLLSSLKCKSCNYLIGVPMLYDDGRPAYRLIKGNFSKRRIF